MKGKRDELEVGRMEEREGMTITTLSGQMYCKQTVTLIYWTKCIWGSKSLYSTRGKSIPHGTNLHREEQKVSWRQILSTTKMLILRGENMVLGALVIVVLE